MPQFLLHENIHHFPKKFSVPGRSKKIPGAGAFPPDDNLTLCILFLPNMVYYLQAPGINPLPGCSFLNGTGRDISQQIPVDPSFISKSNSKTLILNPACPSGVGKGKMWEVEGKKVIRSRT
ncbi:MAG TPA: hypothetical protein PKV91_03830 [Bacillota bacterium]|nr:hypothetical protein [Bacillota bacterium]HQE10450.1 hypothetical protein [Bacillota bacterium]